MHGRPRISRRSMVSRSAAFGLSIPFLGSALAACLLDDTSHDTTSTATSARAPGDAQPTAPVEAGATAVRRAVSGLGLQPGPLNALTDVPGIAVGHFTHDTVARGVTAVLCERGAAAGVSVRGSNPGTINTDALAATTIGSLVHGIGLTGGSVFGLSATTGMTDWLFEQGSGLRIGRVLLPILAGAVIYDLELTDHRIHPTADWGHQACAAAITGAFQRGNVGAGMGATAGKGPGCVSVKGGIGTASLQLPGGVIVGALVVVNAMGGLIHPDTGELFATSGGFDIPLRYQPIDGAASTDATPGDDHAALALKNTTIGVVATNADLDKAGLIKVADLAHDGLARVIRPLHTMYDGDTIFTMAPFANRVQLERTTGPGLIDLIGAAAADAMVLAVLDAAEQTAAFKHWPSVAEAQAQVRGF